ncbi:LIPID PHOSPHATE PHOSPHATASE [Salix koriyanagi]|uniref:LIPID PHOSPHATE PHOSPHATASE n=1 Tax=Salix koriyanagi TaxID=2511006 RepID=A0A9Q0WRQ1_9ROSI|nr:LIPID PHOSPHATE PHOSPHATASE [Salix koriyanagi]
MPDIQLGTHTVRSHGIQIARTHMHDWLILMLLVVIEVVLNVIEPFHRFVGKDMLTDLSYPLKDNTVPTWAVPIVAILLPLAIILVYYFIRRNVYDMHHAILGLMFSVLITGVITDAIKDGVGRPRPDFFWRCFPDGKGVFDPVTSDVMCTGVKSVIKEGHKMLPKWTYFLVICRGHVAKLCIVFLPLLVAALVAVSRVDDYWHHWQDVFAGALIGLTVATFCYLQFFPPPYDIDGWGPHAYFQMLSESRNGVQSSNNIECLNVQQSELESVYVDSQHGTETSRVTIWDTRPMLDGA